MGKLDVSGFCQSKQQTSAPQEQQQQQISRSPQIFTHSGILQANSALCLLPLVMNFLLFEYLAIFWIKKKDFI